MTLALRLEGGFSPVPILDRGLSDEAREVGRLTRHASDIATSITLGAPKRATVEALEHAFVHAQEHGWDGYQAAPADPWAFIYALQFLAYLPTTAPLPEIAADTDGDIAVEWDFGPRRVFSVRIGRDGTLNYAGLVGHTSFHGTELLRESIPSSILAGIERVVKAA